MYTLELNSDVIDIRDIIERIEELETELEQFHDAKETTLSFEYALQDGSNFPEHQEEYKELQTLRSIMGDLVGYGGDEQWRGDWYPVTLIHPDYFTEYMTDTIKDCYDLNGIPDFIEVDWESTAENCKVDYSTVDIAGTEYFYR